MVMVGCRIDMTIKQMDEQLLLKVQMNDGQEMKTKNAMENKKTPMTKYLGQCTLSYATPHGWCPIGAPTINRE